MICLFVPACALIRLINTGLYSFTGLMLPNGIDRLESKISESNWKPQSSDVRLCPHSFEFNTSEFHKSRHEHFCKNKPALLFYDL